MNSPAGKPSIQTAAWETEQLEDYLAHTPIGELQTYRHLSSLIRRNVQKDGRRYLTTALKHVERSGYVFETIRNEGLRRLEGADLIVKERPVLRQKTNRLLTRRERRINGAARDIESFSPQAKTEYFQQLSHISILREANRRTVEKQITKMVDQAKTAIPGKEIMIALFARSRKI